MRGDRFVTENVLRPGIFGTENLKVFSMVDLARQLSGEPPVPTGTAAAPHTEPADFWRQKLQGCTPTPLTCTIPPDEAAGSAPGEESLTFPEALVAAVQNFTAHHGISTTLLFEATWALLLHRYSGEEDVVFGAVKACAERDELPLAAHIVPIRVQVTPETKALSWLHMLSGEAKIAEPFAFTSLPQIGAAAGFPPGAPLFENVLSVGHEMFRPASLVSSTTSSNDPAQTSCALAIAVQSGSSITLRAAFNQRRFSRVAVRQMLGHFQQLIASLTTNEDASLGSLRMITDAERQQLLHDWNATATSSFPAVCVHELFEHQVARTPEEAAVIAKERSHTYAELDARANVLANHLRKLGVGPDVVVAICLERGVEMIVAVLAILKAGGCYLPLDPSYPHERLRFMFEDSHALMLLTQRSLRDVIDSHARHAICLDEAWECAPADDSTPPNVATPNNLAYLIYTSGSTGKPKGVAMIHRPLANLIDWQSKNSSAGAGARTLQFTSLSFDVSFQEIFSTLCSGGTLMLITTELRLNPRELWNFIVEKQIARIFLPFVALQQLAEAAANESKLIPALREVITAGEQLQVTPKIRQLFSRMPDCTLHNHYGPSETHVVTALTLRGNPETWPELPSIGRPIQNTQIYLVDGSREPVPMGLPGEIYIGGACLARGYFERENTTAEKFIPDSFSPSPGARLYKTGDLARWLPNGEIEFLGRIDHQVKIRGYRVELGEIETLLARQDGVREAVVVAREQSPGDKQLVAYVVPTISGATSAATLRNAIKQALPDYMVPAAFVFLERLPLTPSGKVDRKSLPDPERAETLRAVSGQTPWLPIQFQLVEIWEDILNARPIGIGDNFFDLGGHSLLAVRMLDRVEQMTGRRVPVTALFEDATIAGLAERLLEKDGSQAPAIIELHKGGSAKPPFFFLHGDVIGGGFYARSLARHLGEDQPFYVLPPVELNDRELISIEEMAEQHILALRHHQHERCVLGGFCIGALAAYEMARRLSARGSQVDWVVLIDPQLPSNLLRANRWLAARMTGEANHEKRIHYFSRGYKWLFRLRELWNAPAREKANFAVQKTRRLLSLNAGRKDDELVKPPSEELDSETERNILSAYEWILTGYMPPHYPGPVSLFVTEEQEEFTPFLERRWRRAAPRLQVHRIAGRHLAAVTTNVDQLAAVLRESLEKIEAQMSAADSPNEKQMPVAAGATTG